MDRLLKFTVIGDIGVGKSSLLEAFRERRFQLTTESTLTIEPVEICDLVTWQENVTYFEGALLVYDITRKATLESVAKWLEGLEHRPLSMILVGNKGDLAQNRDVNSEEGFQFAQENGLLFAEVSSTNVQTINEMFLQIAHDILGKICTKEEEAATEVEKALTEVEEALKNQDELVQEEAQFDAVDEVVPHEEVAIPLPEPALTARQRKAIAKAEKKQAKDAKTAEAKAKTAAIKATEEMLGIKSSTKPKKHDHPRLINKLMRDMY